MGQIDKLLKKLKSNPKDFTYEECVRVLEYLGFCEINKGRTSGSRVMFVNDQLMIKILLHKPHNRKELLSYQIKQIKDVLEHEGLI